MNPYRTVDRLIAAREDIRRHAGLKAFSLAMWLCPEIRRDLQAMYVQLAQSHAAAHFEALLSEQRRDVARMASRN